MGIEHLVQTGPLILAAPIAAAAGALTFLSPCVLPLVPGYLSYVTGMSGTDAERAEAATAERVAVAPDGTAVALDGAGGSAGGGPGYGQPDPGRDRPLRHVGPRVTAGPSRPRADPARHDPVRPRLLARVRHRGPGLRRPGAGPAAARGRRDPDPGRGHDPAGPAVRRGVRPLPDRRADRPALDPAPGRPDRRPAARGAVRGELDPVHRPHAVRRDVAGPDLGYRRARRRARLHLRPGPGHPVHHRGPGLPARE